MNLKIAAFCVGVAIVVASVSCRHPQPPAPIPPPNVPAAPADSDVMYEQHWRAIFNVEMRKCARRAGSADDRRSCEERAVAELGRHGLRP